ncbi:MAG: MarR family winged helix-turn-helix transcriptional regulator [Spirochaetia bacterium]
MTRGRKGGSEDQEAESSRGCSASRRRRAVATWLRLARLVGSQNTALGGRLRERSLSLAQFDVIAQIGVSEGLTQKELAERLVVTQGNVTQLLQKLEKRRLVTRPPSGRCNSLRLTAAGRRLRDTLVPGQEQAIARLFGALSDAELETLSRLLRKMTRGQPGAYTDDGAEGPTGGQP